MEKIETSCIVVVGGTGGIGSAVVKKYQAAGEKTIIIDKEVGDPDSIVADVTHVDDIKRAAKELREQGLVVRHLVSLAGGALPDELPKDIRNVPDETIEQSIRLNLTSHLWLVKYLMADDSGVSADRSVVFVSSINALRGFGLAAYSSAKAGLLGATRELATSLAPRGIRVNAILPGTVPTPRTKKQPKDFDALLKTTLLGRFASPEDIAAGCHFLTHETSAITGQEIVIDAGQTVRA